MPDYRFTITEYDGDQPWLIVGPLRRETVELEDGEDFATWAAQAWPRPTFQVQLEPEPLGPWQGGSELR